MDEMGLSQADAARRLNVSRSVVSATLGSIPIERFCVQKTCSRPTTKATTPAEKDPFSSSFGTKEKNHYCAAARCRPLSNIRKKNSATTVRNRLQCRSVCKKTSCVRSPQRTTAKEPLMLGKSMFSPGRSNNGLLCCSQRNPIYNGE
ncbi:uncharacterized protein TNCV_4288201 [Trichonephila clavipes]|nr:uncharacterized protein TNCV_4288201 [Trichonephila clavipes]